MKNRFDLELQTKHLLQLCRDLHFDDVTLQAEINNIIVPLTYPEVLSDEELAELNQETHARIKKLLKF